LNVPAIVGMGVACQLASSSVSEDGSRLMSLRQSLEAALTSVGFGISVVAADSPRLPGTSSILFPGLPADILISRTPTVCMSTGSACTSGTVSPSHVLLALGFTRDDARSTVRYSIGRYNTAGQVSTAIEAITNTIYDIKGILTARQGNTRSSKEHNRRQEE
jgi:cysteine desulfurase